MKVQCRLKSYIQPFERVLALQELEAIAEASPTPNGTSGRDETEFVVETTKPAQSLAERLAYWEVVATRSTSFVTSQALRESTVNVVRNGIDLAALKLLLPFEGEIPLPNRRCLRYGTHGIHEYRGKFFPQLVRSLINISGTKPGGIVADPMSGSGTTVVEALLYGCRGLGIDMNPLSVFLGATKSELLSANAAEIEAAYKSVRDCVLSPEGRGRTELTYFRTLPLEDQNYLQTWFGEEVLEGLDDIMRAIRAVEYGPAQNLMLASLSNILRSVSWQKNDDLRVRKEVRLDVEIDPKKEFLEELARSVRAVLAFLYQTQPSKKYAFSVEEGDARKCAAVWKKYLGKVDTMITSPPYATALPYLDTDRLSLSYLGLLARPGHRARDQEMIGNREVTERLRKEYLGRLASEGKTLLPAAARKLIQTISGLNDGTDAGFRRRNLPALLTKYFLDMREVMEGMYQSLKHDGRAYVVVGNNHTIAGGQHVDIETSKLLANIAKSVGFTVEPSISMDMLVSRDIFRKNAMASEEILVLRKA